MKIKRLTKIEIKLLCNHKQRSESIECMENYTSSPFKIMVLEHPSLSVVYLKKKSYKATQLEMIMKLKSI